jgi:aldehyde:ferredoxin oxidoreductase
MTLAEIKSFEYFQPSSLTELLRQLDKFSGKGRIMAGGTDLVPQLKARQIPAPEYIFDIENLDDLNYIGDEQEFIKIGSTVKHRILNDQGQFAGDILEGPEYETMAMLGSNLGILDRGAIIRANLLCDRLGLDTISSGNVIGFIMECFEKGLVTKDDSDGLELRFGHYHAALELLQRIAYRKGLGNLLAEGVSHAAEKIGRESENFAMHVKGLELPGYESRAGCGIALSYAVSPRGGCHRRAWPPSIESMGEIPPDTVEGKAEVVKKMSDENCIFHSMIA